MYYIGIDVGTSSVKAAVLEHGSVRTVRAVYDSHGNTPLGWWDALCRAVRQVSGEMGPDCGGLGLTAQVGTYLLANPGIPVEQWPVYDWGGPGGTDEREELQRRFGTDFFLAYTGMPLPKVPSFPASRLLWFRRKKASEWETATRILAPKDFLYERLTGQCYTDTFTWNGLSNPRTGSVSQAFLDALELPATRFPQMFSSLTAPGGLTVHAAELLGLRPATKVYLGCNDSHASFVGMGITEIGQAFDLTGTSEHVGLITPEPFGDGEVICSPFFRGCATFGVTASSGMSIDWGFRMWGSFADGVSEDDVRGRFLAFQRGETHPPVFLPYVNGERTPIWDGNARGVFAGVSENHTRADMLYSVLEGVVFSVAHIWEGLPEELTSRAEYIRLGGGACENTLMNEMKAALLGVTLEIPKEKNSGALGAGMIAAVGAGEYENLGMAARAYVRLSHSVRPTADAQGLKRRFRLYKRMSTLNRDLRIPESL
ncbi:MAG: hypothetical protein GX929_02285 [Clostridiales bacterium]|jgi:xylulokinase|nr:hypothetical protein [Clostridiales bacterium]